MGPGQAVADVHVHSVTDCGDVSYSWQLDNESCSSIH